MTTAVDSQERLALELRFRPPEGAGWQTYARLTGAAAYDAWYLAHYGREIFHWRQLLESGCRFAEIPRKEKSLLVYLALAARPQFRSVLEIGSSLFEIIDGLRLVRKVMAGQKIPQVDLESLLFLGIENSELLGYASRGLHPEYRTRVYPSVGACDAAVDLIVDRASANLVFSKAEDYAACLRRAKAGVLNLFASRDESFVSNAQDRPFTYFSLKSLIAGLDGRLYHLFGEKSPGPDRSLGRPVVEGFFIYGDESLARDFEGVLQADPEIAAYAAEKRIAIRHAAKLLP